jgi:hypothetical protein
MLPNYVDILVRQERYQDWIRQAEKEWLIEAIKRQPNNQPGLPRQITKWLGTYLARWGSKLPAHYRHTPTCASDCCPVELKVHTPA